MAGRRLPCSMSDMERTLPASPRRREWAREQGYSARSAAMTAACGLFVAAVLVAYQGAQIVDAFADLIRRRFGAAPETSVSPAMASDLLHEGAVSACVIGGWIVAAVWLTALAINVVQTAFVWSTAAMTPDWGRLGPSAGMRRLFSADNLVTLLWGGLALTSVALSVAIMVAADSSFAAGSSRASIEVAVRSAIERVSQSAMELAGLLIVLGVVDIAWRRWKLDRALRMSPDEAREEAGMRRFQRPQIAATAATGIARGPAV